MSHTPLPFPFFTHLRSHLRACTTTLACTTLHYSCTTVFTSPYQYDMSPSIVSLGSRRMRSLVTPMPSRPRSVTPLISKVRERHARVPFNPSALQCILNSTKVLSSPTLEVSKDLPRPSYNRRESSVDLDATLVADEPPASDTIVCAPSRPLSSRQPSPDATVPDRVQYKRMTIERVPTIIDH